MSYHLSRQSAKSVRSAMKTSCIKSSQMSDTSEKSSAAASAMKAHDCDGCAYWKYLVGSTVVTKCCHYALEEHKLRGCPPGEGCTRRKTQIPMKRKFNICPRDKKDGDER